MRKTLWDFYISIGQAIVTAVPPFVTQPNTQPTRDLQKLQYNAIFYKNRLDSLVINKLKVIDWSKLTDILSRSLENFVKS